MNTEILDGEGEADVFFATGINMAMSTGNPREAQPTRPVRYNDIYSGDFIPWGDDNLHPFNTLKLIESNDILPDVIDFKVRALTSGGLQYGDLITDEVGVDRFVPAHIPEVDDFLEKIEHENYLDEATRDLYTHANYFPEILMNMGRKVVGLYCNDAAFTRLGLQEKTGRNKGKILSAFVGADWRETLSTETTQKITAVDPYYRVVDQLRSLPGHKFIIPARAQSNGRLDYQRGPVDFLIASGWLDIDISIPKWKKSIMENQLSVKYHVEVNKAYWTNRWSGWAGFSASVKKATKKATFAKFVEFFKGAEKSGNTLISEYYVDHNGNEWSDWKVKLLETKTWGQGAYVEDSTQSTAHIIMSQGVDQSMRGLIPGKGFSAGSGSDKRVAFNQHVLLCQPHQRKLLRPFDYIAELNGWNERYGVEDRRLKFWFKNTFIATLDHGKDTKPANENNMKKT